MSSPITTLPDAGRSVTAGVTIYHSPACDTSRNVLDLIRSVGVEPRVVEYLTTPPTRAELASLIRRMGIPVRDLLRRRGTPNQVLWDDLDLGDPALTDCQLLDAMVAYPVLINRPIVVTPRGARLCRPAEIVLGILPSPPRNTAPRKLADTGAC